MAVLDGVTPACKEETGAGGRLRQDDAGACSVACALRGHAGTGKIVCIVSGGNIDTSRLCAVLAGGSFSLA